MRRYHRALLYLPVLWASFQSPLSAAESPLYRPMDWAPPTQPLEESAARLAQSPRPENCLAAWPEKQTLRGRLIAIVTASESYLYLLLDNPISVCAAPEAFFPAYEGVTRIKIRNASASEALSVIQAWGAEKVQITSTLGVAQNLHQEPGPVIFDPFRLRICGRHLSSGKEPRWECVG